MCCVSKSALLKIESQTVEDSISVKGRTGSINRLLKNGHRHCGQTSGQWQTLKCTARMNENIDQVNDMVLTQEDQL